LSSNDPNFGGWSSIKLDRSGRLFAISDKGMWLSAKIVTDEKTGAFRGLAELNMALMRDLEGDPLDGKVMGDAEGLAILPDGRFAVSFEQRHRIWLYDIAGKGPTAAALGAVPIDDADQSLGSNEGLEALAATADGDLIGGAEERPASDKGFNAFRFKVPTAGKKRETIEAPRGRAVTAPGYSFVDLDRLPDGDFVGLERSYFPVIGTKIGIRRYAAAGLAQPAPDLKGDLLAQFVPPLNLDNFEGITAQALPSGAIRLYIMSDDNFSASQKTLIYAFDIPAPAPTPSKE
jgi:hypothetical protein